MVLSVFYLREMAPRLAAGERWTAEQRRRFDRFCHKGNALLAERRGDWKAARSALEAWLALEPANARARQRLGNALFGLDQQDAAYKELQRAAQEDTALEPAEVRMGWLFTRAGNLKKAEDWMNQAAKAHRPPTPVTLPPRSGCWPPLREICKYYAARGLMPFLLLRFHGLAQEIRVTGTQAESTASFWQTQA
jgi:tetratricopeptide (TPR) repeat protein